mgnify:CR=1 FL=1
MQAGRKSCGDPPPRRVSACEGGGWARTGRWRRRRRCGGGDGERRPDQVTLEWELRGMADGVKGTSEAVVACSG